MENKLIEDELIYEEINGVKGLKYKFQYFNSKVGKDPKIKKWLSSEKLSKGDNGITCYCIKCNLFFYFQNGNELNETKKKCCNSYGYGYIWNYCGEIFFRTSLCCIKNGLKDEFEEFIFSIKFNQISEYLILFPNITYFIFFIILYSALFYDRRAKIDNNEFSSYAHKDTKLSKFGQIVVGLSLILYSLIYSIPFLILYIILLIMIFTTKFSQDKKQL